MTILSPKRLAASIINASGNLLLSPPYGGMGFFRNHGPRTQRKIALTFDDGPSKPSTLHLLEAMDKLNVKGTFFCVGVHAQYHPDVIVKMDQSGHVIGNHSMWHSRKAGLMLVGANHIDESSQAIADIIGRRPQLYRPPWGWLTPWEAQRLTKRGYTIIGWDIYTLDWKLPEVSGDTIAHGIYQDVQPGSIILLHDSHAVVTECNKIETVRAVEQLVPQLRDQGYEFVTIPQLLGVPAYAPFR